MPINGFEPLTLWLQIRCSTNWAKQASDVADWYSAFPNHLRQTHPHPDYIVTTYLPNSEDGMLSLSALREEKNQYHCFSPVNQFFSIIPCRLTDSNRWPSDYKSDALPTELNRLMCSREIVRTRTHLPQSHLQPDYTIKLFTYSFNFVNMFTPKCYFDKSGNKHLEIFQHTLHK